MATGARVGAWGGKPKRQSRPPSRLDRNKERDPSDREPPSLGDFPALKWNQPNKQWLQRWKPFGDRGPTFVASPYEAVDPRNCERFPNSVYCGNLPFSWPPSTGFSFEFHSGPCEVVVQADFSVLGYTGFPPFHAGVRTCEQPPPQKGPSPSTPAAASEWSWEPFPGGEDPCLYLIHSFESGIRLVPRPWPNEGSFVETPFALDLGSMWYYGPIYGRYQYLFYGRGVAGIVCHGERLSGFGAGAEINPVSWNVIAGTTNNIVPGTYQAQLTILQKVCPPNLPRRRKTPDHHLPGPRPGPRPSKKRKRNFPMNCCKEVLDKLNRLLQTDKATVTTVSCTLNDQGIWAFRRSTAQIDVPRASRASIEFQSERLAQAAELECLGRNGGSGTVSAFVPRVSCVYVQPEDGDPYWDPQTSQFEVQVPADMRDSIIVTAQEVAKGTAELCRQRNNTAPTSADCVAIMPSESYGFVRQSLLKLRFCRVDQFPRTSASDSTWDMEIPNPIDDLDWCEHFEAFRVKKGPVYARCVWTASNHRSGAYVLDEDEAESLNNFVDGLSKNTPRKKLATINKASSPPSEQLELRIVRAVLIKFEDGQPLPPVCFSPPAQGC